VSVFSYFRDCRFFSDIVFGEKFVGILRYDFVVQMDCICGLSTNRVSHIRIHRLLKVCTMGMEFLTHPCLMFKYVLAKDKGVVVQYDEFQDDVW
jgi:hypothetical protein